MESWAVELIRQVPSAAAVLGTVYLFLRWMEKTDERRESNARQRAAEDRAHSMEVNTLWANSIKSAFDQQEETAIKTTRMIVDKLQQMDKAAEERYRKMNVTKELIDAVKEQQTQRTEKP